MGLIRKMTSISTLGVVDFMSDKERVARSARLTKQAVRAQNRLVAEQNELLRQQAAASAQPAPPQMPPPAGPPAGWYPDANGQTRWWDGVRWTGYVS